MSPQAIVWLHCPDEALGRRLHRAGRPKAYQAPYEDEPAGQGTGDQSRAFGTTPQLREVTSTAELMHARRGNETGEVLDDVQYGRATALTDEQGDPCGRNGQLLRPREPR